MAARQNPQASLVKTALVKSQESPTGNTQKAQKPYLAHRKRQEGADGVYKRYSLEISLKISNHNSKVCKSSTFD